MTGLLPETEGAVRTWLRAQPSLIPVIGTRTYFAIPEQDKPTMPFVVFYRVSGVPDQHFTEHPDIAIECWGKDKHEASNLGKTVAEAILSYDDGRHVTIEGIHYAGATLRSGPVPRGGTSKSKMYLVEATFHMRFA